MKSNARASILFVLAASLVFAQSKADRNFADLNPDDSRALKLPTSAVTLKQDGSNVTATVTIRRWPNVLDIQKEQWHTNGTCFLGFLVAYIGIGKGVAVDDTLSWSISNVRTQDVANLMVLQFPDVYVKY